MNQKSSSFSAYLNEGKFLQSMSVFPVVLLFTLSIYTFALSVVVGVGYVIAIIMVYISWCVGAIGLVKQSQSGGLKLKSGKSVIWLGMTVFILAHLLSLALVGIAGVRTDFFDVVKQTLMALFPTLLFYTLDYSARRRKFDSAVVYTAHSIALIACTSIFLEFLGATNFESFGVRYFGFLGDGAPWVLTLPIVIYFVTSRYLLAVLSLSGVVMTLSRGAVLVASVALILFVFLKIRRIKFKHLVLAILLIAISVGYGADQFGAFVERFSGLDVSSNDRTITSINGLKIFIESPVFGFGFNSLGYFYPASYGRIEGEGFSVAASTFVQMLSDGGVIQFSGYLIFLLVTVLSGIRLLSRKIVTQERLVVASIYAWLISMLLVNQFAAWFLPYSYLTPIVFGVAGLLSGYLSRDSYLK